MSAGWHFIRKLNSRLNKLEGSEIEILPGIQTTLDRLKKLSGFGIFYKNKN